MCFPNNPLNPGEVVRMIPSEEQDACIASNSIVYSSAISACCCCMPCPCVANRKPSTNRNWLSEGLEGEDEELEDADSTAPVSCGCCSHDCGSTRHPATKTSAARVFPDFNLMLTFVNSVGTGCEGVF